MGWLAAADARQGVFEDLSAEVSHGLKDGFQSPMLGDGVPIQGRLLRGEGDGDGPGFDLAGPPPRAGRLVHDTALGDPAEGTEFFLELVIAALEGSFFGGG